MTKFDDLSQKEKQAFIGAVKKNSEKSTEVRVIWPDDTVTEETEKYMELLK